MNMTCAKWRDQLLETALGQNASDALNTHLSQCSACATELAKLRTHRERLDTLLPSLATAEPSSNLAARILAATRATNEPAFMWRRWMIAGAAAIIVIAATLGWILNRRTTAPDPALAKAVALAHWQAPTDVLLQLPNHGLLNSIPRLDDSYLAIPMEMQKGEKQ